MKVVEDQVIKDRFLEAIAEEMWHEVEGALDECAVPHNHNDYKDLSEIEKDRWRSTARIILLQSFDNSRYRIEVVDMDQ